MPLIVRCFVKLTIGPRGTGKNAATHNYIISVVPPPLLSEFLFFAFSVDSVPFGVFTHAKAARPTAGLLFFVFY